MISSVSDIDKVIANAFCGDEKSLPIPSFSSVWGMTMFIPGVHLLVSVVFYVYMNVLYVIHFDWQLIYLLFFLFSLLISVLSVLGRIYKCAVVFNVLSDVLMSSGISLISCFKRYLIIYVVLVALVVSVCIVLSLIRISCEVSFPVLCVFLNIASFVSVAFMRMDLMRYWIPFLSDKSISIIKGLFKFGFAMGRHL